MHIREIVYCRPSIRLSVCLKVREIAPNLLDNFKGLWRWCASLEITGFLDSFFEIRIIFRKVLLIWYSLEYQTMDKDQNPSDPEF
jgi:hypothetical protein